MMKTQELIGSIENGAYDAAFRALYCADEAGVARQRARYADCLLYTSRCV